MLLALMHRMVEPAASPVEVSDDAARRVADDGLGPLFWALCQRDQVVCSPAAAQTLESSDLTARVIHARTVKAVQQVIDLLRQQEIRAVLLKGMDAASRYYPQPHLRIMGDIDLLVQPERVAEAVECLKRNGFVNPTDDPDSRWAEHHHAVPLWHDDLRIWVELHRKLVTDQSPFRAEAIFANEHIWCHLEQAPFAEASAWFLAPELAYAYTAAHWYFDLIDRWGSPGAQRQLVDLMFLRAAGVTASSASVSTNLGRVLDLVDEWFVRKGQMSGSRLPGPLRNRLGALGEFRRPTRDLWREISGAVFSQYLKGGGPGYGARLTQEVAALALSSAAGVVGRRSPEASGAGD